MKTTALLLLSSLALCAHAQQPDAGGQRPHAGPPPEFVEACKGKKEGDSVQVKTPRGDTVGGKCRLMMIPDRPAGDAPRDKPRQ